MTPADPHRLPISMRVSRCTVCDAAMAHDQRYCVDCGTRRVPLPARVEAMLDALARHGTPEPPPAAAVAPARIPATALSRPPARSP